jgi:hypothetical protein
LNDREHFSLHSKHAAIARRTDIWTAVFAKDLANQVHLLLWVAHSPPANSFAGKLIDNGPQMLIFLEAAATRLCVHARISSIYLEFTGNPLDT